MESSSDRLIEKAERYIGDSVGIGIEDIGKIPLTEEFLSDLFACLRATDPKELKWGLWFAQGILDSGPPDNFLQFLVSRIPSWLTHQNEDIREESLSLLIRLRENFDNYRSLMLHSLQDSNPSIRGEALQHFQTFLTSKDVPVLLKFKDDEYMSETSMGSPLIYPIRNQALAVIEALLGRKFSKNENVKVIDDAHTVYWWDWKSFLDWWEGQQKRKAWKIWKK